MWHKSLKNIKCTLSWASFLSEAPVRSAVNRLRCSLRGEAGPVLTEQSQQLQEHKKPWWKLASGCAGGTNRDDVFSNCSSSWREYVSSDTAAVFEVMHWDDTSHFMLREVSLHVVMNPLQTVVCLFVHVQFSDSRHDKRQKMKVWFDLCTKTTSWTRTFNLD